MIKHTLFGGPPLGTRAVAWLNIGVQAVLPLTLALATPSASAAPTQSAPAHALPDLNSPGQDATAQAEDEQARKLAAMASSTGSFLSNDPNGDAAASMARGLATGEASSQAQQWLSRFGTARVQIDVDDKLSLKNSQVELLAPLHDTPEQLLFAQGSIHRKDERQQTTLGLGVRRFNDGYMLGANSFLDYDLSRQHARLGLGVEYWRDFLKVNANSYTRLTGWKDSPDVEDYQERPANGWDLRTEAWLPAMPQLGGKLTYEQYYGDEVGLFGKDNRKKDPSAVTVGLTYTPIPLLTLSADQRKGNGGNETTVGAEFNYQIGEPWAKQVDPAGVGALRTLAGSRYDLVERNNHIVLEYRKKQVIQMAAAAHVSGQGGETKSLSVWVNSKYPLSHIDWTAPALLQAGGKLVHDGGPHYSVVLPDYQTGAQPTNVYTLHGVAVDSKGNRSARSETRVTVNAPAVSARHSTFTPANTVLPTDGTSYETLTLAIRDEQQQPVDIALADIQITVTEAQARAGGIVVAKPERVSAGHYEVRVTAGTTPQSITLTPSVQGIALSPARVSTVSSLPDDGKSTFAANPARLPANDTTTTVLTFIALDADGAPVEGLAKNLRFAVHGDKGSVSPPDVTVSAIVDSAKGRYTATLKGTLAGRYTVAPQLSGKPIGRLSAEVELQALPPALGRSTFQALPQQIPASGTDTSTLTFTARDAKDKPVGGLADQLKFELAGGPAPGLTLGDISEAKTGEYRATLQGTVPGHYTFIPHYDGAPFGTLKAEVELLALAPVAGRSKFEITPDTIAADGNEFSTLEFTAKDINDNPVSGLEGTLKLAITNDAGDPPAPTDIVVAPFDEIDKTGVYTTTAKGFLKGTYTLTPQIGSDTMDSLEVNLTLTPLPPAEATSRLTLTRSTMVADDFTTNGIAFEVRDAIGRPITGIAKQITFEITDSAGHPAPSSIKIGSLGEVNNSGVYTAEFVGLLAGDYRLTPKINDVPMGKRTQPFELLTSQIGQLRTYGDYLFPRSSGFPTTAYQEATFIPVLANNVPNDLFIWRSSVSWLTFQPPNYFVFTGAPPTDSGHVTITATSKGGNIVHTYDFKITKWYELGKLSASTDWSAAMKHCASLSLSPVSKAEATKGENARGIGTVASEWGAVQGGAAQDLWLSDAAGAGKYLRLSNGDGGTYGAVIETPGSDRYRSMCSRTLK